MFTAREKQKVRRIYGVLENNLEIIIKKLLSKGNTARITYITWKNIR